MPRPTTTRRPPLTRLRRLVPALVKLLILIVVVAAVWQTLQRGISGLADYPWDLRAGWLALAAGLYLAGLLPAWLLWHRALVALGQRPLLLESLRAYYIGHLGKYVPGKALVFVLRAGLLDRARTHAAAAVAAVFIETLTTMAVGAFLAALLGAVLLPSSPLVWASAAILLIVVGLPTLPPLLTRVLRWPLLAKKMVSVEATAQSGAASGGAVVIGWPFFLTAWGNLLVSWWVFGLSLWATLRGCVPPAAVSLSDLPLYTAAVSLSVVAGFLSGLPGGVLVRDGIIVAILATSMSEEQAIVGAALHRLLWVMSEVAVSVILYWIRPSTTRAHNS